MVQETSRRKFLALSGAALAGAAGLGAYQRPSGRLYAYVGSHTKGPGFGVGGGGGLTVFSVNMSDGSLSEVGKTGPEFDDLNSDNMCVSADGRFLYTINVTPSLGGMAGVGGGVVAFAINRENGSLKHLNTQPSMGANPTAVIIDKTSSRVLVANHGAVAKIVTVTKRNGVPVIENPTDDGTVALFPVKPDGSLEPACDVSVFARRPLSEPGPGAAAHMVIFDRTERWAIASDNGFDHLYVYPFTPNSRTLNGKSFATPPGKAPRHFVFHPRAPYFFMTNEREASVSSFYFDSNTGELRPVQTIPTISDGYSGPRVSPSNIRMHPNAKFVYAANRGDDSIAIFSIDEATGRMTHVDTVKTAGKGPREMNFEPSGRYLFICNLQSNQVATFAVDPNTGKMTPGPKTDAPQAACIDFATL
jgi:6-phosphogluconolactonase